MKYFSHLNTASTILEKYTGAVPFHHFLREYLRQDKKFGSGDRKSISRLCYAGLRTGHAFPLLTVPDKIRAGLFLCTSVEDAVTEVLLPEYKNQIRSDLYTKWQHLHLLYPASRGTSHELATIFPEGTPSFSEALEPESFLRSFFVQPDLFARIRPGKISSVTQKLQKHGIPFEPLPAGAIRLSPATRLDELFVPDQELIIQDFSSQQTLEPVMDRAKQIKTVWDACAASGGKSLLAWDRLPGIELTVSDVRKSILANLANRFQRAGIQHYDSHLIDLAANAPILFSSLFDLVIADVPCSGSGTWSRTPEQLVYFEPDSIDEYQHLQQRILLKILPAIKPGGYLLYITCSVFKKENEDNIAFISKLDGFRVISHSLIKGYDLKADTMFAALVARES